VRGLTSSLGSARSPPMSSMKKRARVKVTGFVGLGAVPLAAARRAAEAVQSSIRPRGAGESAMRGSGLNQDGGRPSVTRPDIGASSPERCKGSAAWGAFKWSRGAHDAALTGRAPAGPGAWRQRISPSRRP
jgi:hypothetical protein